MVERQQARQDWVGRMQESVLGLRDWRAGHHQATFAELEEELDRRWHGLRAAMLAELALTSAATAGGVRSPMPCPECGGTQYRDEGMRERTVVTLGHAPVTLQRGYVTCTQCGYRFFPSGR